MRKQQEILKMIKFILRKMHFEKWKMSKTVHYTQLWGKKEDESK